MSKDSKQTATTREYSSGAKILSIGVGTTGLVTFAYFSIASHILTPDEYSGISLLWILMFVILSVIYRPIEQLLARTIAERSTHSDDHEQSLRVAALVQVSFAVTFLIVALILVAPIRDGILGRSQALYWILIVGVLAYSASYFARGWLAGHRRFGLYGGLMLFESCSRTLFVLAAAVGITTGQTAVALGIAAAPFASLLVLPLAALRKSRSTADVEDTVQIEEAAGQSTVTDTPEDDPGDLTLKHGAGFAVAVFLIMLSEQALINAGPLAISLTNTEKALTGVAFNLMLIARAPLQLFQSIQASLLPHLSGLEVTKGRKEFNHAVLVTVLAIAGFAGAAALFLLVIGPLAMDLLFGGDNEFSYEYQRVGLMLIGLGMGFHLIAGVLNQAALARKQAAPAAAIWIVSALLFIGWMLLEQVSDPVLRVEIGYFGGSFILSVLLFALYRRPKVESSKQAVRE